MRIAHIIDPLQGVIPDVYFDEAQDDVWRRGRLRAFEQVYVSAVNNGAGAVLITGRLFVEGCASDELVSRTLNIIREQPCPIVWLPDRASARRLHFRDDIPANLFLMDAAERPEVTLGGVRIIAFGDASRLSGECGILLFDGKQPADAVMRAARNVFPRLSYAACGSRIFIAENGSFRAERLSKIEKTSFDDKEKSGYYLLSFEDGILTDREKIGTGLYDFVTLRVNIENGDDLMSVCEKCELAARDVTENELVRIVLGGSAGPESFVLAEQLREALKERFYYVEVFSSSGLDIDKEAYINDISLDSEFVLGVLADDTLSDAEKSRIIQCGRSALRGKELSE